MRRPSHPAFVAGRERRKRFVLRMLSLFCPLRELFEYRADA
jgi:hypothetical protein